MTLNFNSLQVASSSQGRVQVDLLGLAKLMLQILLMQMWSVQTPEFVIEQQENVSALMDFMESHAIRVSE